jgi:hypothetical protein
VTPSLQYPLCTLPPFRQHYHHPQRTWPTANWSAKNPRMKYTRFSIPVMSLQHNRGSYEIL